MKIEPDKIILEGHLRPSSMLGDKFAYIVDERKLESYPEIRSLGLHWPADAKLRITIELER